MSGDGLLYRCTKNIQQLLYPPHCLLCGGAGAQGLDLCEACYHELPWRDGGCARCGAALPASGEVCGQCLRHPGPVAASFMPFAYAPPLDQLILGLKFGQQLAAARLLGTLMGKALLARDIARPQCLVAVPMHARRLRERGYNQAHELARQLAARCGLTLDPGLVQRARHTEMQSRLDGAARRRNLRDAFVVRAGELPGHVALVDDVVTTGSTVNELADALQRAGVARVDVWACARA